MYAELIGFWFILLTVGYVPAYLMATFKRGLEVTTE